MYKITIKIPVYNCSCYIIISDNIVQVINRYVKKHKWGNDMIVAQEDSIYGYAVSPETLKSYYIFYDINSLTFNYISHEIAHMVDFILEERGIELTGETRAYTTGYLSEQIFSFVLKNKLLVNKWLPKPERVEQVKKMETATLEVPVLNQSPDLQMNN